MYADPQDPRATEARKKYNASARGKAAAAKIAQSETFKERQRRYRTSEKGIAAAKARREARAATLPGEKVFISLRSRLKQFLNGRLKAGSLTDAIGCSKTDLELYLSNHPNWQPDWTLSDRGVKWELDHVRAMALYDPECPIQFAAMNHYTNYQPLSVEAHAEKTREDQRLIRWFKGAEHSRDS